MKKKSVVKRDENNRWLPGHSGNPAGRPKGSRNKITLLKAMAEEYVRENHTEKMLQVVAKIIDQAAKGDKSAQKMVWDAIMSKGLTDSDGKAKEKVEIKIGVVDEPRTVTIEGTAEEVRHEQEESGDDELPERPRH